MLIFIRVLKYLLNAIGALWMAAAYGMTYALMVRYPSCEHVMPTIRHNVMTVMPIFALFILVTSVLDFLIERKIEKRKDSKEYLVISVVHVCLMITGTVYTSWEFYNACC